MTGLFHWPYGGIGMYYIRCNTHMLRTLFVLKDVNHLLIQEKSDLESHMVAKQVIEAVILSRLQSHHYHCRGQFFTPSTYFRLQGVYMV